MNDPNRFHIPAVDQAVIDDFIFETKQRQGLNIFGLEGISVTGFERFDSALWVDLERFSTAL
jgi:hypothetical protein